MRILGFGLTTTLILLAMYSGHDLGGFIDVPSAVVIIFLSLGMTLTSGSSITQLVLSAFSTPDTNTDLDRAISAWSRLQRDLFAASWIGFIIGLISLAANIQDYYALGPGLATAAMTILYAMIAVYTVCRPVQRRLEDARGQSSSF